jgi:hypothetical protein
MTMVRLCLSGDGRRSTQDIEGREALPKGKDKQVDLLVPTILDQAFHSETIFFHFYKTFYLSEEVNCTEPSPSVRVPCRGYSLSYR